VGNLAWDVSWQDLKDHMRTAGGKVVTADVAMEGSDSNRSKGFGLVSFASARDAEDAIARLNDSEIKGRKIFVREDREAGSAHHHQDNHRQSNDADHRSRSTPQFQPPQQQETAPSRVVYVGNLPWEVTWQDLQEHMQRGGGQVTKADVLQEESGRSKGCGLVEFETVEEAGHAISVLNESELNGRKIFVRFDRDQSGAVRSDGTPKPPAQQHGLEYKLFVGSLAWAVRWQELKDHFKQAGLAITHADVQREVRGDDNSRSKGYGFVSFETREEAERAVSVLHGSTLLDRQIVVRQDYAQ
jgi:RNA recognition motif-containing protein